MIGGCEAAHTGNQTYLDSSPRCMQLFFCFSLSSHLSSTTINFSLLFSPCAYPFCFSLLLPLHIFPVLMVYSPPHPYGLLSTTPLCSTTTFAPSCKHLQPLCKRSKPRPHSCSPSYLCHLLSPWRFSLLPHTLRTCWTSWWTRSALSALKSRTFPPSVPVRVTLCFMS